MKRISFIATIALACSYLSAQIPTEGLIRNYPFVGSPNDISVNLLNGTLHDVTLDTGRFDNINCAYSFDKSLGSYMEIPTENLALSEYTYSIWVKLNSLPVSKDRYFLLSIGGASGDQGITYNNNFTHLNVSYNGWGYHSYEDLYTVDTLYNHKTADLNTWYHLVATRTIDSVSFFVNGELVGARKAKQSIAYGMSTFYSILGKRWNNTMPFDGVIDDLKIYDRPLSRTEVLMLFNEGTCNVVNPIYDTVHVSITDTISIFDTIPVFDTIVVTDTTIIFDSIAVTDTLFINYTLEDISNPLNTNTIKVYPNPTSSRLTINFGDFASLQDYKLSIINSIGTVIYTDEIVQKETTLDLSSWTGKGVYFIQLYNPNNELVEIRKIILK